ncbi:protein SSUH2 homolog [Rhinoderma darwinii]|uniref:protein SSUH2 homolog n=1 Tax=Rhinoderma darwinii TaxID=43563 RepID=UPI003F67EF53
MDDAGSELHPAGSSAPDTPISVISGGLSSDILPTGSSTSDAPISVINLNDDEGQDYDCPKYEDIIQDGECEPPPPYMPPHYPSAPLQKSITVPTSLISEDVARQALMEYAKKKCCYSTGPAQHMLLQHLQPFNTFRYRLDTFTETRICKWVSDPYYGEEVDGPGNGPPPDAWDLQAEPPTLFQNAEYYMALPHTSSIEICLQCGGLGRSMCRNCFGAGRGLYELSPIHLNSRRKLCLGCGGSGYQHCTTCGSTGKLLKYIQVTIKWENHNFEFVADHNSDFTTKRFKKVTGEIIFSDEQQMVLPVTNFPKPSINEASENVIYHHRAEFTNSKIMRQRHSIEWLPLTKVDYTWNGAEYDYFVYGKENRAYTQNYPRKCCCTIM